MGGVPPPSTSTSSALRFPMLEDDVWRIAGGVAGTRKMEVWGSVAAFWWEGRGGEIGEG